MTIELELPDMSCGHCVKTITQVAQSLDPKATVRTDLSLHKAWFETNAQELDLRQALAEEGYPAKQG